MLSSPLPSSFFTQRLVHLVNNLNIVLSLSASPSPQCAPSLAGVLSPIVRRPPIAPPSSRHSAVLPSLCRPPVIRLPPVVPLSSRHPAVLPSSRRPPVVPPSSRRPACPLGCSPSPLPSSRNTTLRLNTLPGTRTHPPNTRYPRKISKTTATCRFLMSHKRWLTSFSP